MVPPCRTSRTITRALWRASRLTLRELCGCCVARALALSVSLSVSKALQRRWLLVGDDEKVHVHWVPSGVVASSQIAKPSRRFPQRFEPETGRRRARPLARLVIDFVQGSRLPSGTQRRESATCIVHQKPETGLRQTASHQASFDETAPD